MDRDSRLRTEIQENVSRIKTAKDIFNLFKKLNYPEKVIFDVSSRRKKSTFDFKKEDEQRITEIYSVLSFDEKLPVFLLETSTLTPSFIRSVTNTFDKQYLQFLLIFSSDYSEIVFVFPNREKIEAGKHKLKLTKLIVNRSEIHYTDVQTLSNICYEGEGNWRDVWRKWKKAFSVERVTDEFFEDYKNIFFALRNDLHKQNIPRKESHEFTLQFLNRIMFIYFISKKKWLEHPRFIEWVWVAYKKLNKYGSDEFYEKWLRQIFFKAFNNRSNELTGLPNDVIKAISNSPYLNGGLFRQNGLDNLKIKISDKMFQRIFNFFEAYNFTIKEDMPLESEIAVDPQMIGYVYESLANVAEEIYDRNDLGIFYTPRVEVDFMCRRSLVEYLSKHLPEVPKEKFYHLIFDLPEEKEKIEKYFEKENLWYKLEETLYNLSVADPACGSGAFLVGMLNVLAEIYRIVNRYTKRSISDFALKNKIIQYSIYGVDVMPWAIHAAELRLWLQLIVETEFKKEELRKNPLLPNLNLNLRIGDSLVQEMGGLTFNVRSNNLKPHLKKKLENLKQEKRKYFENSPTAKFKTPDEVKEEEVRLFEEIINERIECLETDIEVYKNDIKKAKSQRTLTGEYATDEKKVKENEAKIEGNEKEIEKLKKVKQILKDHEKKPFVWDIDFAEIFGDKNGFDIVIGNPPYVRYQKISPPNKLKSEVTIESKRDYKEKLVGSIKVIYEKDIIRNIDKQSDYYLFFYFHGLSLLNESGTFCFITSNSWLDVEYGRTLQEFVLKYAPVHAIYDNMAKKSFAHADVNTIIALLGAPIFKQEKIEGLKIVGNTNWPMLSHTAKFIMFKKPFEECINTTNLIEIEKSSGLFKTSDMRIFCISQKELYEEGLTADKSYFGTMWGGRYLRSPDIFLDIQNKSKEKLIRLRDVVNVETYINTLGSDKFFFVSLEKCTGNLCTIKSRIDDSTFDLERQFLTEFIESPKEIKSILIKGNFKTKLFRIPKDIPTSDLKKSKAYEYIKFGKRKNFKTELPKQAYDGRKIIMACYQGASHIINYNPNKVISHRFFRLIPKNKEIDEEKLVLLLNSTLSSLSLESFRNPSLGGGVLAHGTYTIKEFIIPKPEKIQFNENKITKFTNREIRSIFEELGINPDKPIREQEPKPLPDRAELDKIIFDELGLTKEERKEVYWAVCELVKQRLEKAKSLKE